MARSVLSSRRGRRGFLRDRRGTWRHVAALAWQAWHLETCSCTLRGRRGTLRPPPSFHVAGVDLRFTWQAWYSTYSHTTCSHTTCTHTTYSRRRGTWQHGSSLCVAGVARMALGWLWWCVRICRWIVSSVACCFYRVAQ